MDREMRQLMVGLGACWIGAIGLILTGLICAIFGGSDAVRVFLFVLLGLALANAMLMALIRVYTRLRLDLPIVGGVGMAAGCSLLLIPATSAFPSDGLVPDGMDRVQVVRALPGDEEHGPMVEMVSLDTTPGGYFGVRD
jgi:uncharacterized membrane protein YuzA (DUF378 family)